jgi:hypothetical protein
MRRSFPIPVSKHTHKEYLRFPVGKRNISGPTGV